MPVFRRLCHGATESILALGIDQRRRRGGASGDNVAELGEEPLQA
jgi:hypothetical protein